MRACFGDNREPAQFVMLSSVHTHTINGHVNTTHGTFLCVLRHLFFGIHLIATDRARDIGICNYISVLISGIAALLYGRACDTANDVYTLRSSEISCANARLMSSCFTPAQ